MTAGHNILRWLLFTAPATPEMQFSEERPDLGRCSDRIRLLKAGRAKYRCKSHEAAGGCWSTYSQGS